MSTPPIIVGMLPFSSVSWYLFSVPFGLMPPPGNTGAVDVALLPPPGPIPGIAPNYGASAEALLPPPPPPGNTGALDDASLPPADIPPCACILLKSGRFLFS